MKKDDFVLREVAKKYSGDGELKSITYWYEWREGKNWLVIEITKPVGKQPEITIAGTYEKLNLTLVQDIINSLVLPAVPWD